LAIISKYTQDNYLKFRFFATGAGHRYPSKLPQLALSPTEIPAVTKDKNPDNLEKDKIYEVDLSPRHNSLP